MEEFNLMRVVYGKKDTPLNKREYRVKEFGSSAVGSMEEIKDFLKDKGYSKFRFVLHDPISDAPPVSSIGYNLTKKKPKGKLKGKKGWVLESARHSLASKGIKTGRKVNGGLKMGKAVRKVLLVLGEPLIGSRTQDRVWKLMNEKLPKGIEVIETFSPTSTGKDMVSVPLTIMNMKTKERHFNYVLYHKKEDKIYLSKGNKFDIERLTGKA